MLNDEQALETEDILVPEGYILDFVSNLPVRATPEETEAVQVFSRRLVEDLGYPKQYLQTRPQFRVRRRPSDNQRSYPVDIVVFTSQLHQEEELQLVVECKKKNRRDGRRQLEIYLTMSHAHIGAWFNGGEHLYLLKTYVSGGEIRFDEIPALPRFGQRIEDIGRYRRSDLIPTQALRPMFRDIRNHLAGNLTGITRDEALAQQIINVLFCKIYDELDKGAEEYVDFRVGINEDPDIVHNRIIDIFAAVKSRYDDVFSPNETIEIDPTNLTYVVGELQNFCITEAARDAIGEAFEVFIGPALRGSEGQFFTPRNVIHMMIEILDPQPGETIIDPASGSGGFLIAALQHVWATIVRQGTTRGWSEERIREECRYVASRHFKGIEKDRFLSRVTKAYMAIVGDGRGGVFCENSLIPPESWDTQIASEVHLGSFDIVVTNPPFGTKIPIRGRETLSQYDLGHQFKRSPESTSLFTKGNLLDSQSPQLLFIERCLQLLRPNGRMGIVLPESILGMPTYAHVVSYLREVCRIVGVVSMPEELFQPHTHAKTCVVFIQKRPPSPEDEIFMSIVEWCGHDSRGNLTIRRHDDGREELLDDVPNVPEAFRQLIGREWYS